MTLRWSFWWCRGYNHFRRYNRFRRYNHFEDIIDSWKMMIHHYFLRHNDKLTMHFGFGIRCNFFILVYPDREFDYVRWQKLKSKMLSSLWCFILLSFLLFDIRAYVNLFFVRNFLISDRKNCDDLILSMNVWTIMDKCIFLISLLNHIM